MDGKSVCIRESESLRVVLAIITLATRIKFVRRDGHETRHKPTPAVRSVGDPTSLSQRWKTWKRRFETYLIALDITNDKQKRALLLYQAGQETQEIFDTLSDTGEDYKTALAKLDDYFLPKKNVDYETFQFRQAKQKMDEPVDQFVTRLRKLAVTCEFPDLDRELKSAVIQNCTSKRLRRYALREDDMTLDKILSKARSLEASESQAKGMEDSPAQSPCSLEESVKRIRGDQRSRRPTQSCPAPNSSQCRQCGLSWPHTKNPCPARGKPCNSCGKPNHFAKMCLTTQKPPYPHGHHGPERKTTNRKPQVNQVSAALEQQEKEDSSSDDEYIFTIGRQPGEVKVPKTDVEINGVKMRMMIDTGASTDIVDEAAFRKMSQTQPIKLAEDTCRIFAWFAISTEHTGKI